MNGQVTTASQGGEESNELNHQHRKDERAELHTTNDCRDDEEMSLEHDDFSLEDLLQEKLERIAILEHFSQVQGQNLEKLQNQLNENDVKHKEEVYWLRLELDLKRRENDACEERMAELYNDLRDMIHDNGQLSQEQQSNNSSIAGPDTAQLQPDHTPSLVADLQAKVAHYERALGVMDNQVGMVKTSCDSVVKTLKEEISDLMEDRCKMEIDLLNKMAALDDERRQKQINYNQLLKVKDETIRTLRKEMGGGSVKSSSPSSMEDNNLSKGRVQVSGKAVDDLEDEVATLRLTNERLEVTLKQERSEADDTIDRLEESNTKLERKLESMADDLALLRMSPDSEQTSNALTRISRDREEIVSTLDRVATIWEGNDASMRGFHHIMMKLCAKEDDAGVDNGREELLSTLECARLLHSQVKAALLLIELKLRNQLSSLKTAKVSMMWAAPSDEEVTEQMRAIQSQALQALNHVEASFMQSIERLEDRALDESSVLKETLRERNETLHKLQIDHRELKEELESYKKVHLKQESKTRAINEGNLSSNDDGSKTADSVQSKTKVVSERLKQPKQSTLPSAIGISQPVLEQLQAEVMNVVERMKGKNEMIAALTQDLGESRARERVLKRELKRIIRRQQKLHQLRKREQKEMKRSKEINTRFVESKHGEGTEGTTAVSTAQLSTADSDEPMDGSILRARDTGMINRKEKSTPTKNMPTVPAISPLQPSPREVNNVEVVFSGTKSTQVSHADHSDHDS